MKREGTVFYFDGIALAISGPVGISDDPASPTVLVAEANDAPGDSLADAYTASGAVEMSHDNQQRRVEILHNPMMAFWRRAVVYFEACSKAVANGYQLLFEDYALIIGDLGLSLCMLFGRHWTDEARAKYARVTGRAPDRRTPDLLKLLKKYYPPIEWDLPAEDARLWCLLKQFIGRYYVDIVKHFEFRKFENALLLTYEDLCRFMETTRRTWIWFIYKCFEIEYDSHNPAFRNLNTEYADLSRRGGRHGPPSAPERVRPQDGV